MDLSLHTLLAGPILRRAEPKQVSIWIACSIPLIIRAEIFRVADLEPISGTQNKNNTEQAKPIGLGSATCIRLGEHLYIGLVTAKPIPQAETIRNRNNSTNMDFSSFPTHELLAYDIELSYYEGNIKKCQRLQDLGLLTGDNAVIYTNRHDDDEVVLLPTFFLQGRTDNNKPLNILHGSCRKLHGKGEDCLAIADRLIAPSVKNLNKRPSVLFLTGDQIYADDVAGPLIQHLTEFGAHLLGWEEEIVGLNKKLTEIGPGERQQFISEHAKFTSENGGNHLISFGEFSNVFNFMEYPKLATIISRY